MSRTEIRWQFWTDVVFMGNMSRTRVAVGQMSCNPWDSVSLKFKITLQVRWDFLIKDLYPQLYCSRVYLLSLNSLSYSWIIETLVIYFKRVFCYFSLHDLDMKSDNLVSVVPRGMFQREIIGLLILVAAGMDKCPPPLPRHPCITKIVHFIILDSKFNIIWQHFFYIYAIFLSSINNLWFWVFRSFVVFN